MAARGQSWFGVLAGLLLLAPAGAGSAADKPAGQPAPGQSVEPAAAATLRAALERIAGARSFMFRAEVLQDVVLPSGEKIQFPGLLDAAVRRPDGLRVRFDGEQRSTNSWYDGKTFVLLSPEAKTYATCPAAPRLDELFTQLREAYGFSPPLAVLLREDVVERLLVRAQVGRTVGTAKVGGVESTHLAFRGEHADWQVWVAAAGEPVVTRLVITWTDEPGAPQLAATFLSWDFAPRLEDAEFVFAPPPDAVRCEFQNLEK